MNPHRVFALAVAVFFYALAALVLAAGLLYTRAVIAQVDPASVRVEGFTTRQMVSLFIAHFLSIALPLAAFGWSVHSVFGRRHRQEKLAWKSLVGCLRLGGLGCALWIAVPAFFVLITGRRFTSLPTSTPVSTTPTTLGEYFAGSWPLLAVLLCLLGAAWFVAAHFAPLKPKDRARILQDYGDAVRPYLHGMTEPQTRAFVQELTEEVLTKLDAPFKTDLLVFLSESGLLKADAGVDLHGADFREVNLSSTSLPRACLRGADLRGANLRGAFLLKADLRGATLSGADLSGADLEGANLRHADLNGAVLEGTNLRGADLEGAKVTREQLDRLAKWPGAAAPEDASSD